MPISSDIYGQQIQPRINTPFENLSTIIGLKNQQEAGRALADQRRASADLSRQKAEQERAEVAAATQVRALFGRVGQDGAAQPPTPEELASVIGPEKATDVFKGFEALREARSGNAIKDTARIASVLGGVESMPGELKAQAYEGALQQLISDGTLKPGQAPPKYDANFVKAKRREALSVVQQFEQEKPIEVTAGSSLMKPTGEVIGTAPGGGGSDNKPSTVKEYEYAVTQGFKGSFEDYQNADANRKQKAATERAPYFTYQPVFDPQGRPISAIRFDARGGPPQVVDVSALTGGGQLKPPPGTTAQQSINDEVSVNQLDRLKTMFDGGAARFIGPAEGRARSLGQSIPGVPVNKTFADFEAASAAFRNSVIKAITGAAMSEAEATRIRQQIPDVTDKPEVWLSKAAQTRKNLGDLAKVLATKAGKPPTTTAPPKNETPDERIKRLLGGG